MRQTFEAEISTRIVPLKETAFEVETIVYHAQPHEENAGVNIL